MWPEDADTIDLYEGLRRVRQMWQPSGHPRAPVGVLRIVPFQRIVIIIFILRTEDFSVTLKSQHV